LEESLLSVLARATAAQRRSQDDVPMCHVAVAMNHGDFTNKKGE
jgi:hypothetical protein